MNLPVAEIKTRLDGLATDLCYSMESADREKVLAAQSILLLEGITVIVMGVLIF